MRYKTFDELMDQNTNMIQKRIIALLRPIAKKFPDKFVKGFADIWLKKSKLGTLSE